jgi:hypothetical protein
MKNMELFVGMENPFQHDMNHYLFAVLGTEVGVLVGFNG